MSDHEITPLAQYCLCQVRAWAEANVISVAMYVEEVERRRAVGRKKISDTLRSIGVTMNLGREQEAVTHDYHDDCV